ncbi:MAG TPA: PqiC family protein [Candidatus Desulfovibrio intestinavium]|uniref:PqiC family protein n=1 Tax=Candidatus Desulfovibrio intestinavium TaxID=2838534 RepID=A0A9D2HPS2_9BACT|nr:PqiC family protein [Candidatus Desulfovibrio intestinavium]
MILPFRLSRLCRPALPVLLLSCLALTLAACGQSAPTRYYVLDSGRPGLAAASLPTAGLRIAHVGIPGYLDRQGVVSRRDGDPLLEVNNFDIWAEPLDQGIRRVLREVLSPDLLGEGIAVQNNDDSGWLMALVVDVLRLDGAPGEAVHLEARWSLLDSKDHVLARGSFADSADCPAAQPGAAATGKLVASQSLLVQRLGQALTPEIVRAMRSLRRTND